MTFEMLIAWVAANKDTLPKDAILCRADLYDPNSPIDMTGWLYIPETNRIEFY